MPALRVKVCGVTTIAEAEACVDAGVDMLGLNFVAGSPRRIDPDCAAAIAEAVRGRVEIVGVVADEPASALRALRAHIGLDRMQLHGNEPPELVEELAPVAFKAVRIGSFADVELARRYPGLLLLDARVAGKLGGTGIRLDAAWVSALSSERPVLLAGGLTPDNVGDMVRRVRPWGVDVASGVEAAPAVKDPARVAAFVAAARRALSS